MASLMWRVYDRCRLESHIVDEHVDVVNGSGSESARKENEQVSLESPEIDLHFRAMQVGGSRSHG